VLVLKKDVTAQLLTILCIRSGAAFLLEKDLAAQLLSILRIGSGSVFLWMTRVEVGPCKLCRLLHLTLSGATSEVGGTLCGHFYSRISTTLCGHFG